MSKLGIVIILSVVVTSLPWTGSLLWDVLSYNFNVSINSNYVRYVLNAIFGILIGLVLFKQGIKLTVLPIFILLFVTSSILFSINTFNTSKKNLLTHKIEYSRHIQECEKESNYKDLWDYMSNGCHFTTEEFIRNLIYKVLALIIMILLSKTILKAFQLKNTKRKNLSIIDQEE